MPTVELRDILTGDDGDEDVASLDLGTQPNGGLR